MDNKSALDALFDAALTHISTTPVNSEYFDAVKEGLRILDELADGKAVLIRNSKVVKGEFDDYFLAHEAATNSN